MSARTMRRTSFVETGKRLPGDRRHGRRKCQLGWVMSATGMKIRLEYGGGEGDALPGPVSGETLMRTVEDYERN